MLSSFSRKNSFPADSPRRALVLGGGGAKGAYQIGVWQAFRELGITFQVVTGTSVGALNGALIAQGSYKEAVEMWENMSNDQVLADIPPVEADDPGSVLGAYRAYIREIIRKGGVDTAPLEGRIRQLLDEDRLRNSGIRYGVVTVAMGTLRPVELFAEEMPPGTIADYMMASASCFPAFPPREIGNQKYIDGGYHDLLPVELALRAQPPVTEVYVVDIDGIGIRRSPASQVPVHTIRSHWDLGSMLIFESSRSRRNIRLGYLDTLKVLGRCDGWAYGFQSGQKSLLERRYLEPVRQMWEELWATLPGPGRNQLDRLLQSRLSGTLSHGKPSRQTESGLLLHAAELAGELLGLDPTPLYTVESFNRELREILAKARQESGPEAVGEALKRLPVTRLGESLRELAGGTLLQLAMDAIRQQLMGGEPFFRSELLAVTAPRQTLAALYLLALERETL